MDAVAIKGLDMNMILQKPSHVVSTKDALSDVEKIEWSEDVLDGKTKVIADIPKEEQHV